MAGENIHIGTSGWSYKHWLGTYYPERMAPSAMLPYYAERFRTVELNTTFYHLPKEKSLQNWRETAGAGFLFAVKGSRYITHMKKLKDTGEALATFLERVGVLGPAIGPILFQLPPKWRCNPERLREFLSRLPDTFRYAFEFRNQSWFNDDVYRLLHDAGAAFCIYELQGVLSPRQVTGDLVYIRLHGPDGPYQGSYDTAMLTDWAGAIVEWARQGRAVYCYFDNDQLGYAAHNAAQLQEIVGGMTA